MAIPRTGSAVLAATSNQIFCRLYFATSPHETGDAFACDTSGFAFSTDASIDAGVAPGRDAAFFSIAFNISPCRAISLIHCTFAFPPACDDTFHPLIDKSVCAESIRVEPSSSAVSLSIQKLLRVSLSHPLRNSTP